MNRMIECPKPGCLTLIAPDRFCCTMHWNELSWRERRAWMKRSTILEFGSRDFFVEGWVSLHKKKGADDEVSSH